MSGGTVGGRNPAPVDVVIIPLFTRFYTSQVVQDFFHQQYDWSWVFAAISSLIWAEHDSHFLAKFPILTKVHFGPIPPTFHHHFWGDLLGVLVAIICIDTHLKLTCLLKRDHFHRKYSFQPLIFRGTFVSFLGEYILRPPKNHVLVPKESSRKVKKLKFPGYLVTGRIIPVDVSS